MNLFLCKLLPPRPTFPTDMTADEQKVMAEHAIYWQNLAKKGLIIVVGPVLDPNGAWGVAIVDVENHDVIRVIGENDPAVKAGLKFEIYPMGPSWTFRS